MATSPASAASLAWAYYDLPVLGSLKPYIGLGAGFVKADLDVGARATMNSGTVSRFAIIDSSDTLIGYRGAVGIAYDLGTVDLTLGYTYTLSDRMHAPGKGALVSFDFDRRLCLPMPSRPVSRIISKGSFFRRKRRLLKRRRLFQFAPELEGLGLGFGGGLLVPGASGIAPGGNLTP